MPPSWSTRFGTIWVDYCAEILRCCAVNSARPEVNLPEVVRLCHKPPLQCQLSKTLWMPGHALLIHDSAVEISTQLKQVYMIR